MMVLPFFVVPFKRPKIPGNLCPYTRNLHGGSLCLTLPLLADRGRCKLVLQFLFHSSVAASWPVRWTMENTETHQNLNLHSMLAHGVEFNPSCMDPEAVPLIYGHNYLLGEWRRPIGLHLLLLTLSLRLWKTWASLSSVWAEVTSRHSIRKCFHGDTLTHSLLHVAALREGWGRSSCDVKNLARRISVY